MGLAKQLAMDKAEEEEAQEVTDKYGNCAWCREPLTSLDGSVQIILGTLCKYTHLHECVDDLIDQVRTRSGNLCLEAEVIDLASLEDMEQSILKG